MNLSPFKRFVSLGIAAALLFNTVLPAFAAPGDDGRIKPAKHPDKEAKRGTIEIKNDTGKECNDFHIAFRPSLPTFEKVRVNGKDPFPSGYRPRGTQAGMGPPWADFGRQKGDGTVKDGETIKIDIAWTEDMPEIAYFVWTLDGVKQSAVEGAADQKPEIKGRDADVVRKAAADAKKAAEKKAAEEEAKAKKEAEKEAKKAAKKGGKDSGIQRSMGGTLEGFVESDAGTVRVILPDDLRAGDSISGTVIAEPKGNSAQEREQNLSELNGMVLDLDGEKVPVRNRKFQWTVPTVTTVTYYLFKEDGTPVRATMGPIELPKPAFDPDLNGTGYSLGKIGQAGRPMRVTGPFDPALPTEITVGGRPAEVLAESPRQTLFRMPAGLEGLQKVAVIENGKTVAEGEVLAVNIRLSVPKAQLRKGETTTLKVEVVGLDALYVGDRLEVYFDPAYIVIQNDSPNVIEFFGPGSEPFHGTIQPKPKPSISRAIRIAPRMMDSRGHIVREVTFRAKEAGPFAVSAHFWTEK